MFNNRSILAFLLTITSNVHLIAQTVDGLSLSQQQSKLKLPSFSDIQNTENKESFDAFVENDFISMDDAPTKHISRRNFGLGIASNLLFFSKIACAEETENEVYENPNIPPSPEERSGLVILRIAEVAQFQEKILRAVASGAITGTTVTPQQIVFGTQILLRNSNIAGNMQLMIKYEIPRKLRTDASRSAAKAMNTIQLISSTAAKIERPFTEEEMVEMADLYRILRVQLNDMYEFLPKAEKDKYYGYFVAVTEYEKKIAEGVYNPELDGVLKLDY